MQFLNDWEQRVIDGQLQKENFLTDNTAEGLGITLKSTIDLTHYLLLEFNCKYVLTGKINPDSLEVIILRFQFLIILKTHLKIYSYSQYFFIDASNGIKSITLVLLRQEIMKMISIFFFLFHAIHV